MFKQLLKKTKGLIINDKKYLFNFNDIIASSKSIKEDRLIVKIFFNKY
jgi:hypothetical protein